MIMVWGSLCIIPAFGQYEEIKIPADSFRIPEFQIPLVLKDSLFKQIPDIGFDNTSPFFGELPILPFLNDSILKRSPVLEHRYSHSYSSRMPVYKPKGNFPMRLYTPDTMVYYHLLIKKP